MVFLSLVVLALAASVHAYEIRRITPVSSGTLKTEAIPPAEFYVPLTGKVARPAFKSQFLSALRHQGSGSSSHTTILAGAAGDSEYVSDITIGGQQFKVIVDTGS